MTAGGSIGVHVEEKAEPAVDAVVRVIGQPGLTAATDEEGLVVFDDVPAGDYTIGVKCDDSTRMQDLRVSRARSTACHVKM